jgi:hypothetical protein
LGWTLGPATGKTVTDLIKSTTWANNNII